MERLLNKILHISKNEYYDDVIDLIKIIVSNQYSLNDNDRVFVFETLLRSVKHVDNYSSDILTMVSDLTLLESLFSIMNYKIHRSLNGCLKNINSLTVLEYLVKHPFVNFKVGYKQSEALRFAVLNDDIDRLVILLSDKRASVHDRGDTTNKKSSIELAVMFDNKKMIRVFLDHGIECRHSAYSNTVNEYVTKVECEQSLYKIDLISLLNDKYIVNNVLDYNIMDKLLEDNMDPLQTLSVTSVLYYNFSNINSLINDCRKR